MLATESDFNGRKKQQLHVAMFPWLAFGHIIPFLELSKSIAEKGHRISFLSTTRNIKRLPPVSSPLISLVALTLPHVDQLPQNAEATMDVRTDEIPYLKKAFDGLQHQLTQFLLDQSPDWIIYDFAPYWLPSIASGLGISRAFFSIINPWFLVFTGRSPEEMINGSDDRKTVEDYMVPPKWVPFPTKIRYLKHEANWIVDASSTSRNASGVSDMYRNGMVYQGSDCVFIRYCYEFEPQWLTLLEELINRPVIPVGLMPPVIATTIGDDKDSDAWLCIKKWLDGQQKGQVVYVALGSEVTLTKANLVELALGLELSGLPFFWALRKLPGSMELAELPDGFIERTRKHGMVWTSWVPQKQILSHESVGGFLTHCGWGSIIEGLMFGQPLIMLPFLVDQGPNARVLVENGVGMEVPRNEEDGTFSKEWVGRSVRLVVVEDEGKVYKAKSLEMSKIFGDANLQEKYTDEFVAYLEKQRSMDD